MSEPLTVFTGIPPRHTASFYYRLEVPLRAAEILGLPLRAVVDTDSASISPEDRFKAFAEADVVLLYQPVGEAMVANLRGLQGFIPSRRDRVWKWPPTIVMETDDNLFNVSPLNPAYKHLGIRDMSGKDIPLGHHIGVMRDGEPVVLWKDGENGFSLLKNRQQVATWRRLIEMSDAISCSTQPVAEAVKKESNPRRLKVFPNAVLFQDYEQVDIAKDPKKVRILWQGGAAHYEDFYPLRQAFGNITKKYPEVEWVIWGAQYQWVNELMPPDRYIYKPWRPYQEYRLRLAMVGHDIAIAPLTPNVFNNCRSAIKWYEASVLKHPAATVAQRTAAYAEEIQDGETGLLFDNPEEFETQVSRLIEDTKLRKTIAANAKDWISENRDALKLTPGILAFWEELRAERKLEQPRVSDEQWEEIEAEALAQQASENGVPVGG